MRSMLLGISALVLVGSASGNAAVSLVGTDVTITYLFPTVTSVFGTTVLPITTNPTTLDCPAFGSGICAAFAENAAITIGADSFTCSKIQVVHTRRQRSTGLSSPISTSVLAKK